MDEYPSWGTSQPVGIAIEPLMEERNILATRLSRGGKQLKFHHWICPEYQ